MKKGKISLIALLILAYFMINVQCITKYDFNACRIQNCVSMEKLCIEDEGQCLKGFSDTRKWYIFHYLVSKDVYLKIN